MATPALLPYLRYVLSLALCMANSWIRSHNEYTDLCLLPRTPPLPWADEVLPAALPRAASRPQPPSTLPHGYDHLPRPPASRPRAPASRNVSSSEDTTSSSLKRILKQCYMMYNENRRLLFTTASGDTSSSSITAKILQVFHVYTYTDTRARIFYCI